MYYFFFFLFFFSFFFFFFFFLFFFLYCVTTKKILTSALLSISFSFSLSSHHRRLSCSDYLDKAVHALERERCLVRDYLHDETMNPLIDACEDMILRGPKRSYLQHILYSETGVGYMLSHDQFDDLRNMHKVLSGISEQQPMADAMRDHIIDCGKKITLQRAQELNELRSKAHSKADDMSLAVARQKYALFHDMDMKDVTEVMVKKSSAGLKGWYESSLSLPLESSQGEEKKSSSGGGGGGGGGGAKAKKDGKKAKKKEDQNRKTSPDFISSLFDLHRKYAQVIHEQFNNDVLFEQALVQAFQHVVKDEPVDYLADSTTEEDGSEFFVSSNAEMLSHEVDYIYQHTNKYDREQLETILTECSKLFEFLSNKDLFITFHTQQLALRLLGKSANTDEGGYL